MIITFTFIISECFGKRPIFALKLHFVYYTDKCIV